MKCGFGPDTVGPVIPPAGWVSLSPETYDRFRDGYIALLDALAEARPYVSDPAVLERIDAAAEMRSNLAERTST